ncbi:MAG: helix-turn-helix transcriptional regulator [Stellaceae bacterium]
MRILRQRQVIEKVGYSPMHIWRLEKAGRFPHRVKLGPNSVGWVAEEIDAWIEARIAERDAALQSKPSVPGSEPAQP